jgi:hypothetical protein
MVLWMHNVRNMFIVWSDSGYANIQIWTLKFTIERIERPCAKFNYGGMTHQNFIHRFVKTPLIKYDIHVTLKRMVQAPNYFIWIFCHFSWNYEKAFCLQIKNIMQSPNFAVNWCIVWISNKICLKGAIKIVLRDSFFQKLGWKVEMKIKDQNSSSLSVK